MPIKTVFVLRVQNTSAKTQIRKQQCSDRPSAGFDRTWQLRDGDEDQRSSLGHMKQMVLSCSYLGSQRRIVKSDRND